MSYRPHARWISVFPYAAQGFPDGLAEIAQISPYSHPRAGMISGLFDLKSESVSESKKQSMMLSENRFTLFGIML
ncbi:hypothetical protein [Mesorhizobium sp. 128a]